IPGERRGQAIAFEIGSTGNGRNPIFNGRRQPSSGGTSRMTRECQVRICERLGGKFPGPTRPELAKPAVRREARYLRKERTYPPSPGRFGTRRFDQPGTVADRPPSRFSSLEMCYV